MLRKGPRDKGHQSRGDDIPSDGPGKLGTTYRMTAVLCAQSWSPPRAQRGESKVEKDTASRRSNHRWPRPTHC
jgi:hypothetical protein